MISKCALFFFILSFRRNGIIITLYYESNVKHFTIQNISVLMKYGCHLMVLTIIIVCFGIRFSNIIFKHGKSKLFQGKTIMSLTIRH